MCSQDQEDHQEREAENHGRGYALGGFLGLVGHAHVVVAHALGHDVREEFFEGRHGLPPAIARRGDNHHLGRVVLVEAHGEFRPVDFLGRDDRSERNHASFRILDVKAAKIIRFVSVLALRLDIDLPYASKSIEVVDEDPAHVGLQGLVDAVQGNILFEHHVAVHVREDLGHVELCSGDDASQFRPVLAGLDESLGLLREEGDSAAVAILEHEGDASRVTHAGNRRRRKGKRHGTGERGKLGVQAVGEYVGGQPVWIAIPPRREGDEEKSVVGGLDSGEQAESHHGVVTLNPGCLGENFLDFLAGLIGALKGGGWRQLDVQEEIALILLRQEACGQTAAHEHDHHHDRYKGKHRET